MEGPWGVRACMRFYALHAHVHGDFSLGRKTVIYIRQQTEPHSIYFFHLAPVPLVRSNLHVYAIQLRFTTVDMMTVSGMVSRDHHPTRLMCRLSCGHMATSGSTNDLYYNITCPYLAPGVCEQTRYEERIWNRQKSETPRKFSNSLSSISSRIAEWDERETVIDMDNNHTR